MIRVKVLIFALLFAVLGSPLTAIASDITKALYYGTIVISNNSTATTNVATVANISTTNLIAGGYLNATANNTVMRNSSGADVPFMPGYTPSGNFWCMWVPSMGADSYLTYLLYTDNSFNGELRYFPGNTGMVVADNASLEPADNFSIIQRAWVDTTAGLNKQMVLKPDALQVAISSTVNGTINVLIPDDDCLDFVRPNSDWVRIPDDVAFSFTDGAGNDEPFTILAWVNFDDATTSSIVTKRNDPATTSEWYFATTAADLLQILIMKNTGSADSENVVSLAITGDEGSWHHYAATYDGSEVKEGLEVFRDGINSTNARNTGGAYAGMSNTAQVVEFGSRFTGTSGYLDGLMAEVKIYDVELSPAEILDDFNGIHKATDLVAWWEIDEGAGLPQDSSGNGHHANQNLADWVGGFPYRLGVFLTAAGISSGEHLVTTYADSVNMSLIIDGTIEDSQPLGGVSIVDTAGNWTFFQAGVTPYVVNQSIYIGGNWRQFMQWSYNTIFPDGSTAGTNHAYPSFRTASSDLDVIGDMIAFTPISQAQAPAYALGAVNPFISSTPNITGNFTIVPPPGTFPLAGVITAIANATATPPQLPLLIIACFVILAASLTTSFTMRKYGSGTLLIKAFVIIGIMGVFIALGDFGIDWWMTIIFAVIAIALSMASRQQSWQ